MQKRQLYLGLLLLLAVGMVVGLLVVLSPSREPAYGGRTLSTWMTQYFEAVNSGDPQEKEQAVDAVRNIGTNALPYLLKWIRYKPPAWRKKLDQALRRVPLVRNWNLPDKDFERLLWAREAFAILGPTAGAAIPDLTQLIDFDQTNGALGSLTVGLSVYALAHLGPGALAPLVTALTNEQMAVRKEVLLLEMSYLGTNATPALPVLIEFVHHKNQGVAVSAIRTLGKLKLQPALVVPVLRDSMQDTRAEVRRSAAFALGEFGAQARLAVPALQKLLEDPDPTLRSAVHNALRQIDPQAFEKVATQ